MIPTEVDRVGSPPWQSERFAFLCGSAIYSARLTPNEGILEVVDHRGHRWLVRVDGTSVVEVEGRLPIGVRMKLEEALGRSE